MSASLSATIMEFLNNLFGDEEARAAFLADPEAVLDEYGLGDLSCADFDDAIVAFVENSGRDDVNLGGTFHNTVPQDGESEHEAVARHLADIVTNNTYITNEDNDVYNDSSVGTVIADGDVKFDNDIVSASGDGAVAAGDDIEGDVVTGDDNVLGNNNQVGDGAFGTGSVSGGVTVDDGSAFASTGGTASGSNDDNDVTTTTTTTNTDNSDNSVNTTIDVDDSFQANTEVDDSFQDNSETETDVNTETGPGDVND